ncbi:MAG: EVE domain-containing protein [Acidobacteriota bacterium]|nr:EVE domain-containing protein [Acidobacteriota bacterium]
MNHWLMKEEAKKCTFEEFIKDGKRVWKKVKNYQARNFIREMKKDDLVLFYNSGDVKAVQGVAKVISEGGYESPEDKRWNWVDIAPVEQFENEVTLADIKSDDFFEGLKLIKQTRLSVMPVSNAHFDKILAMSQE